MPKKKKWGKIGAPHSAKRKKHLEKIREHKTGTRRWTSRGKSRMPKWRQSWKREERGKTYDIQYVKSKTAANRYAKTWRKQGHRAEVIPVYGREHYGTKYLAYKGPKRKRRGRR